MVGDGANRLRAGRVSCQRPDSESRRVLDEWMLWKGTALMLSAPFQTINSVSFQCGRSQTAVMARSWASHGETISDEDA
jgi:hypothetical protein